MGRIVIPRYQRQRAQLKQRPKGSGYFANGFGPQEMSLISKLTDLAVAGGGQIARAVQISNREDEQAEAQAEYDRRLQSETQAAAREELEALDAPMSTADAFFADMPIAGLAEPLYNKPYRETLGVSGQPATPQRGLYADQSLGALTQPRGMGTGIISRPGSFAPEDVARSAEFERNLLSATLEDAAKGGLPGAEVAFEIMNTLQKRTGADRVNTDPISRPLDRAAVMQEAIRQGIPSPASVQMSLPEFAQAQQAAQRFAPGEEERAAMRAQIMERAQQEALQDVGPAPERKLFRIADILAAAPSARTEEQRAMLLQAAVDSPDIQAANLSDLAKGAYRDRAMQAVMKLFPEEEEALSELDMLRMQSMRESMETENLRQQKLQAALDKEAAKADRLANALTKRSPKRAKAHKEWAFYYANFMKHRDRGMPPEDWREGAGRFANVEPAGMHSAGLEHGIAKNRLKKATTSSNTIVSMTKARSPRVLMTPSERNTVNSNMSRAKVSASKARGTIAQLQAIAPDDLPGRGYTPDTRAAQIKTLRDQVAIHEATVSDSQKTLEDDDARRTPAADGAVYNAPTYIPGQGFDVDLTKPPGQR